MKIQHSLILTLFTSLITACGTPFEKMSAEDFSKASDKFICDYLPPPGVGGQYIKFENFRNEVERRNLSTSQCCIKRINKAPGMCYGYVQGEHKEFHNLPRTDNVELFFNKQEISKPFVIIGKLVDEWIEKDPNSSLILDTPTSIFHPDASGREISRSKIKERFNKTYKARAKEVGADALLVDGSNVIKANMSIWGGTINQMPDKLSYKVIFYALKYE